MAAIGVGLLWWGYWWGLGGFSLVKGWNNNFLKMANPLNPPEFTRACYTGSGVWPTGNPGDSGSCPGGKSKPLDQGVAARDAANQGRPNPDSVQSRF